jgi:hypothetical protein
MAHYEEDEDVAHREPARYASTMRLCNRPLCTTTTSGWFDRGARTEANIMTFKHDEAVIHAQSVITICDTVFVECIKH